ncbi:MAG: hypothetical protein JJ992_16445, partial [Planctomycetes bacterium]|nr:hypothetical protein [Planctomycetota bacterium]
VPGPMPWPRLCRDPEAEDDTAVGQKRPIGGNPDAYVAIGLYSGPVPESPGAGRVGLTLHLPQTPFGSVAWRWALRGANLCAWEAGLNPPLKEHEIVIDPQRGRFLVGVGGLAEEDEALPVRDGLFVSATYGFSGPTGAHPVARNDSPQPFVPIHNGTVPGGLALQQELAAAQTVNVAPLVIEIRDSRTYDLDIEQIAGATNEGGWTLNLGRSLTIRAASGQRPVLRLKKPLAFRPVDVMGPESPSLMEILDVKLEGLYISWDHQPGTFDPGDALITRAAVNRLTLDGCTLDPGSHQSLDGTREPARYAFQLTGDYGFTDGTERDAFDQVPQILVRRSICGPMAIDDGYELELVDSIVDAASGIDEAAPALALHAASGDPETGWGPALKVRGMTCFGRMRVESASGEGGIWLHRLEVRDDQIGCLRCSAFSGNGDRLPQHEACVSGPAAAISFASEVFGQAGYAQLRQRSDRRVLEQGPNGDAMGAFGYLANTRKWKNINIRYREFMPVGIRPVLVPVT